MLGIILTACSIALAWMGWVRRGKGDAYACTLVATAVFIAALLIGPDSSPDRAPCEAQSADTGANQTALSEIHGAQRRDQISEAKAAALSPPHVRPQAETEA